tara:strand:+ start:12662 stop:12832 length:171 start_codon:yes stop_codon:yes gene_type:complete
MKIQKEKSSSYKGRDYFKYKVNIPEKDLYAARLKVGDNLEISSELGKITLKKKNIE